MCRVLIVDDDQELRETLVEVFPLLGATEVVDCRSFSEVERAGERAVGCSVCFLDVNLGEGEPSGIDVARWLQEHGFTGSVVFLTGHAAAFASLRERTGVTVYSKPVSLDVLGRHMGGGL